VTVKALKRWFASWVRAAPPKTQGRCLCCGTCCRLFGGHLQASKADIERWTRLGRDDLLRRVSPIGWIWMNPETGRFEHSCPFLGQTGEGPAPCAIHDVKPDICRAYPTIAHARRCVRGVFV
jgi:Fe-S-cluster containining protein